MERYIMIFEDGEPYASETFTEEDMKAIDAGILQVVRVSDMKTWFDGEWSPIRVWGE